MRQNPWRSAANVKDSLHRSERNQAIAFLNGFDQLPKANDHETLGQGLVGAYSATARGGDTHREFEVRLCRESGEILTCPRFVHRESVGHGDRIVVEENPSDAMSGPDGRTGELQSPFRRSRCEGSALNEQVESQTVAEPIGTGG